MVLDRTAFYTGGGGQPNDTGLLAAEGTEYLVTKVGSNYGVTYFPSVLFEDGETLFDEIISKLNKVSGKK